MVEYEEVNHGGYALQIGSPLLMNDATVGITSEKFYWKMKTQTVQSIRCILIQRIPDGLRM